MQGKLLIRSIVTAFVTLWVTGSITFAQQQEAPQQPQNFATAYQKARAACDALWADHVLDPLRDKFPLGGQKPTFAMLTDRTRLLPKDKPLAELGIKTIQKCRALYADAYVFLPQQTQQKLQGFDREVDSLTARLYVGKITIGEFNVGLNRILVEESNAFYSDVRPTSSDLGQKQALAEAPGKKPPPVLQQAQTATVQSMEPRLTRLALVIGNSNYTDLPKLKNPANDAHAIVNALRDVGFDVTLVTDASETNIRRAIRKFADQSDRVDVALVYYAGHGAQVNGGNYLLPVDMEVPHTEADIELSSLKVDDLVNSIRSPTKIVFLDACRDNPVAVVYYAGYGAQLNGNNYILPVDIDIPRTETDIRLAGLKVDDLIKSIGSGTKIVFLDACRDNPALFKNILSGRGSSPVGLAPATGSNFTPTKPGGGVFIAYATDAGSVADEGHGPHSPFTQALLNYIQKPISIDDMFSLVTREVRSITKGAQRPYKYASLENIICLSPECSIAPVAAPADVVQQAGQSEDGELQKSEHTEWTLYEIVHQHVPQFMQLSSIQKFGDRSAIRTKQSVDESEPRVFHGKPFAEAAYTEHLNVYDCTGFRTIVADERVFDQAGKLLFHYKWGDPQYLNLKIGTELPPGSIGFFARNIGCNERVSAPLLSKKQIIEMKFDSLVKSPNGEGEVFRYLVPNQQTANQKTILMILRWVEDHNIKDTLPQGLSIPNPPNYRTEVDRIVLKCDEKKYLTDKVEYWNSSNDIVRIQAIVPSDMKFLEFDEKSIHTVLQGIYCNYSGLGLQLISDNGSIKVGEIFKGSPAERAGVKPNDIITEIDHGSLSGLTVQQVTAKARGPANSKVVLTISRDGQGSLELTATRENIQPAEMRPSR